MTHNMSLADAADALMQLEGLGDDGTHLRQAVKLAQVAASDEQVAEFCRQVARGDGVNVAARAEKAERAAQTLGKVVEDQCRDIARITRSEHLVGEDGDADWGAIWERGYSMAESLREANATVKSLRAEQPRPLTADVITDEMVERAREALRQHGIYGAILPAFIRNMLAAALTEPPSRPEGAEGVESQIEQWLYDEGPDDPIKARDLRSLADFLAERGVRVTTEEEL